MPKTHLREKEVAKEYGPSRSLLRKLRREKRGPNYIVVTPRMILYSRQDIEQWLERRTVRTPAEKPARASVARESQPATRAAAAAAI